MPEEEHVKRLRQYPPVSDRPHFKRSRRCAIVDIERFTGATYEALDAFRAVRRIMRVGSTLFVIWS